MTIFRLLTVTCMSALLVATAAGASSFSTGMIVADQGSEPLTLTGAKKIVELRLTEIGKASLRPGRASFDRDGNVSVEVVNNQGIAVGHVRVDAKSGQVTNAKTGAPLAMNG